jgi:PAS domain S-box-containing protein
MSFFRWIWQEPEAEGEWGRFVSTLFYRSVLLVILAIVCLIGSFFATEGSNLGRLPSLLSLLTISLISFALLKASRLSLALHFFVWANWLVVASASISSIGVYAPAYMVSSLLILISALGLSRRNTILFTGTVLGFGLLTLYGHSQGWIVSPENNNLNPLGMWITSSSIFLVLALVTINMRETSSAIVERLQYDQALYRAILEDQTEYIVRWKKGGIRTFANGAYLRYFGMSREEAIGSSFYPQINEDDHQWINEKIARLSPENPIDIFEHRVVRPDGTEGWQEWSDRALYNENGEIVEYQSVGRDITAVKELEERQRELEISKERESFLRDFLSTMSHDLQTPLSVMRTNLYMLRRNPEKSDERIEKIDKQIDRLSGMITDILTVARLEHLPELERRPNACASLIENSINLLRDEAKAKNISLELTEDLPNAVMNADATEFQRALSNLISNAIKYTPDGGNVMIAAHQEQDKLIIEVADTGIGIEAQDLPHIFERFYRAKNAQRFEKGTGLGLAIVKRIIELHDGTISASSKLGEGSRFTIQLPLSRQSVLA